MPTNPLDLEEIKGLMAKATPGPWLQSGLTVYALDESGSCNRFSAFVQGGWTWRASSLGSTGDRTPDAELEANAALVVALHAQLPTLIKQHERMRATIADAPEPYEYMKRADFSALPATMRGFIDAHRSWLQRARSALNQQEETNGYRS